jgi:hypothetical protein
MKMHMQLPIYFFFAAEQLVKIAKVLGTDELFAYLDKVQFGHDALLDFSSSWQI